MHCCCSLNVLCLETRTACAQGEYALGVRVKRGRSRGALALRHPAELFMWVQYKWVEPHETGGRPIDEYQLDIFPPPGPSEEAAAAQVSTCCREQSEQRRSFRLQILDVDHESIHSGTRI